MRILGFDISTVATGWCLLEDGKLESSGVIRPVNELAEKFNTTKKAAKESLDELETFRYTTARTEDIINKTEPDVVVIEDAFLKFNASVLRLLARLSGGVLHYWVSKFDKDGTKTYIVMASKARATVGCKGNGTKADVKFFIYSKYGIRIADDNEADAFILALYGYRTATGQTKAPSKSKARRRVTGRKPRK